ncbi:iron uptake protein [Pseudoxanthomonas broegbernensis]|uniref:Iron uptake protein n=1 Tax=Pseudoxanthomonas broegbernensis TaxID=83619 RepID=A0A7V8GQ62_9GAMM|nr:iron uptake protein [Pseudoxanthomonas broegbernensis]KAF1688110.1 iron uptake protein [Pseudoxanthomonas broegbernensis]MBB6065152.1 hypothetical protein [Pseudoxanthomonas broegbernensis]
MSRTPALANAWSPRLRLAARVAAAILGGYVLAWGFIAAAMALLFKAGMEFHDAEFLSSMLGLLLFLAAFLWTIATRRLAVAWLALPGGGAAMAAIGSLVQASMV